MTDRLTHRQLNRATLARQGLLERTDTSIVDTVSHLVGMQAQVPLNPYTGLWSRLQNFDPLALSALIADRALVRIVVMRGTIHLVTADDCLPLRALAQPILEAELSRHSEHKGPLRDLDLGPVLAFAAPLLAAQPRTGPQLRALLAAEFPTLDPAALAYACRNHLALVQVPPRGLWARGGQVTYTTAQSWLGRESIEPPSPDEIVARYFRAFGPASVADVAAWSRFTGCREIVDRMRPRLRRYLDPKGRELFDVADVALIDAAAPAPPRILPEYDNVLLSHADRSRFLDTSDGNGPSFSSFGPGHGTVLIDGFVRATWSLRREKKPARAVMTIRHAALPTGDLAAMTAEANLYLDFVEPEGTSTTVELAPR